MTMASTQDPNKASARRIVFFSLIIALNYGRSDLRPLPNMSLLPFIFTMGYGFEVPGAGGWLGSEIGNRGPETLLSSNRYCSWDLVDEAARR